MNSIPGYLEIYRKVLTHTENFERAILNRHGQYIQCREGCSRCCILESLLALEAFQLALGLSNLSPSEQKNFLLRLEQWTEQGRRSPGQERICPFLADNRCLVYPFRPVICRTHGYPIFLDGRVDYCPLNFKAGSGQSTLLKLESSDILNLQGITEALCLANNLFLRETGFQADANGRVGIEVLPQLLEWNGCQKVFSSLKS